jgi:hypothetical protein
LLTKTPMRSFAAAYLLFLAGCTGDLVELGPKGITTPGVDMAVGSGGSGGTGGGGGGGGGGTITDMAMAPVNTGDLSKVTFAGDIEPDIVGTNMTACMGQPCGCTNTGCHNAGNLPILGTNAGTNYTNLMNATYSGGGAAVPVINKAMPAMSPLLQQLGPPPTGQHPGGQKFSGPNDPTYLKWLAWISQGAPQ